MQFINSKCELEHSLYTQEMERIFWEVFEKTPLHVNEREEYVKRWRFASRMQDLMYMAINAGITEFCWKTASINGWLNCNDYIFFAEQLKDAGVTHDYYGEPL